MLETYRDAQQFIDSAPTLFSPGWKHVASLDEVGESDEYDYETEEEEVYVTMDLGGVLDPKALQSSTHYQLVGLDTPLPFLKVGNQVFQGEVTPLIGEEIICGHIRNIDSHPPMYKTPHRLTFRAVTLEEKRLPRESTHGPSPLPPSASLPPPDHPMDVDSGLEGGQATPGGSEVRFDMSRSPRGEGMGTLAEATATMGLGSPRRPGAARGLTPNAQAGPSYPIPAQGGPSGTSGLGLTGTSGPLDEMPIPETGFAPFLPPAPDMRVKKPRKVGSGRQRRVLEDPEEMEGFNVDELTDHQTLSVGPLVLARLNLPIPENGEYAILKRKDIVRALNGQSPIRRRKRLSKPSANMHGTHGGGGDDGDAPSPGPQGPTGQVTMGNQVAHGGEGLSGLGEMTRVIRLPGGAGAVAGATIGRGGPGSRGGRGSRGPRGSRGRGRGRGGVLAGVAGVGGMGGAEHSTPGPSRGGTPLLGVPGPAFTLDDAAGRERSGSASGPGALESEQES